MRCGIASAASTCLIGPLAAGGAFLLRDPDYFDRASEVVTSALIYIGVASLITPLAAAVFKVGQILPRYLSRKDVRRMLKAALATCMLTALISFWATRLEMIPRSLPLLHFIVLMSLLLGARYVVGGFERRMGAKGGAGRRPAGETLIIAGGNDLAYYFLRVLRASIRPSGRAPSASLMTIRACRAGRFRATRCWGRCRRRSRWCASSRSTA